MKRKRGLVWLMRHGLDIYCKLECSVPRYVNMDRINMSYTTICPGDILMLYSSKIHTLGARHVDIESGLRILAPGSSSTQTINS